MRTMSRSLLGAMLFVLGAACSSDDGGGNPNEPNRVIAKTATNSGDGQTAGVTEELPEDLRVIVTLDGVPVEGVDVAWAVSANGGSVVPASATTGPDGIAVGTWTFGTKSGDLTATATLAGATGSPVSFSGTAEPDVATGFVIQGGDDQTGLVNTPFSDPLTVLMHDQYNNPVAGQNVGWSVTSGDADLFGTESATSAVGVATMTATFGPVAGPIEIEAAPQNGLPPKTFSAISAPAPSAIVIEVDNNFFLPQQDTVAAGGTVTWKWIGSGHTVTSDPAPGLMDSGIRNAGFNYPIVFDTPGTYNYLCTQHPPGMVGTIVVL
jgi:plastocyanin